MPTVTAATPLRTTNRILSALVAVLGLYLVLSPILPSLQLALQRWLDTSHGVKYATNLASELVPGVELPEPPRGNRLIVPSVQIDADIVEGSSPEALNRGIWRRPAGGSPESGGNTILTGHRYMYTAGPNTFFNLPAVEVGDLLAVLWDGQEYDYRVTSTEVVDANEARVEAPSSSPTLTLYTCTPLFSAAQRFVVHAEPVELGSVSANVRPL